MRPWSQRPALLQALPRLIYFLAVERQAGRHPSPPREQSWGPPRPEPPGSQPGGLRLLLSLRKISPRPDTPRASPSARGSIHTHGQRPRVFGSTQSTAWPRRMGRGVSPGPPWNGCGPGPGQLGAQRQSRWPQQVLTSLSPRAEAPSDPPARASSRPGGSPSLRQQGLLRCASPLGCPLGAPPHPRRTQDPQSQGGAATVSLLPEARRQLGGPWAVSGLLTATAHGHGPRVTGLGWGVFLSPGRWGEGTLRPG